MNLVQFSQAYGLNVAALGRKDVTVILKEGFLNKKQAEELLAELNQCDYLWQTASPEVKCADFLW